MTKDRKPWIDCLLGARTINEPRNVVELLSIRLMKFLEEHDLRDYCDHFCWKTGGDGDNGEALMYEMDAFFETVKLTEVLDK